MVSTYLRGLALILVVLSVSGPTGGGVRAVHAQVVRSPELKLQFSRAERAFRSRTSLPEAKSRLDRVVQTLPDDSEALLLRAQVLLAMNQPEAALVDAQRVVSLNAASGLGYLIVCESARLTGRIAEARRALDEAGRLITTGADLHVRLSYNAQQLGLLDQAEAYARVAFALDPALPAGTRQLAHVFIAKGREDAAAMLVATGLSGGILSPDEVRRDPDLSLLIDHRELRSWFGS